jgi:hypothetical protein
MAWSAGCAGTAPDGCPSQLTTSGEVDAGHLKAAEQGEQGVDGSRQVLPSSVPKAVHQCFVDKPPFVIKWAGRHIYHYCAL